MNRRTATIAAASGFAGVALLPSKFAASQTGSTTPPHRKLCVSTMADLRALVGGVVSCLTLLGYYRPSDGGGSIFYWDASATEPDDAGTIIRPASAPASGRWKRVIDGPMSVRWFGAKADGSNDYDGVANGIAAAINAGIPLYFPAGTYGITLPTNVGVYNGWNVKGDLLIIGDGATTTKIKLTNFTYPGGTSGGFYFILAPGKNLELRDISLDGPTDRPPFKYETSGYPMGIYGDDNNQITLRRVKSALLSTIIKHAPAPSKLPGRVHIYDSVMSHRGVGILMGDNDDSTAGELVFHNSSIAQESDGWTATECIPCSAGWHNLYIYPAISIDIDGCQFLGAPNNGLGVISYRADLGGGSVSPLYYRIQNTYFSGNVFKPVITGRLARCQILNCTFRGSAAQAQAITIYGDTAIIGCSFYGGGGVSKDSYAISDANGFAGNVLVQGCTFNNDRILTNLCDIRRDDADLTKTWLIQDCQFYNPRTNGTNILVTAGRVTVDQCRFFATDGVTCIRLSGGTIIVRDNSFYESGLNSGPLYIEDVGDVVVDVTDNNFASSDYMTINRAGSKTIQINGQGNTSHNGWAIVNGNVTGVSGNLHPKRGISAYDYDGVNAPNDMHLNWNGDTFEINEGTHPAINNVYFDGQV